MLFNSYTFIFLFLPITFAGYYWLARYRDNGYLLAAGWLALASLVFYGFWSVQYLALLIGSICFNFLTGIKIAKSVSACSAKQARFILTAGIVANLLLLGYFKYFNFFLDSLNAATGTGFEWTRIILPIGISFFTFTQIAFLVDVYKGLVQEYRFVHYILFVTYFPHLIAGPVLHHKQMMPQFSRQETYKINPEFLAIGLTWLTLGLAKKVLLADNFAAISDPVFELSEDGIQIGFSEAWLGALAYTLQLYFDFSGYSDMAVGLALLFGVKLPFNFHSPYKSSSIIDFWRRWHMTLSQFLKDYLYIPLGGNRKGSARRYVNLMITMILGGLWHGAGWTYVLWGTLHGFFLVINHAWKRTCERTLILNKLTGSFLYKPTAITITLLSVVVAWVVFRSTSVAGLNNFLVAMSGQNGFHTYNDLVLDYSWNWILVGLFITLVLPNTQEIFSGHKSWLQWRPNKAWAIATAATFMLCVMNLSKFSPFVYFQF